MSDKLTTFETWFQRVWVEEDPSAIDDLFPAPASASGLGPEALSGPDDFKGFQSAICGLVRDIKIDIDKVVEQDDWISLAFTFSGVAKKSAEPVKTTASLIARIEDGLIQECHNFFDFMTLWGQLDLLPKDSLEQGLSGQSVVVTNS